jgi:hypothetical protein
MSEAKSFDAAENLDLPPEIRQAAIQFMVLYDAAQVLAELSPPRPAVTTYLRAIADKTARDAGMPGDFVQAMIASRPPLEYR